MGKIAFRLAELIGDLDERVFGEKAVVISIIPGKPKTKACMAYAKDEGNGDAYGIFKELDEIITEANRENRFLLLGKDRPRKYKDFPPYTLEDFLVSLAVHEVRHRVQELLQIALFSPKDESEIIDPYLRAAVQFEEIACEMYPPEGPKEFEYDARIIAMFAAKIWHDTKDFSKIAEIVKTDANLFKKREGRSIRLSRFYLFFLYL